MKRIILAIGLVALVLQLSFIHDFNKVRDRNEALANLEYWSQKVHYETQKLSMVVDETGRIISRLLPERSAQRDEPTNDCVVRVDAVLYRDENGKPLLKTTNEPRP